MKRLKKMLSYTRDHDSEGERLFVKQFIMPYKPTVFNDPLGEALALVIDVADKNNVVPPVLWSCHVDTVHAATAPTRQTVIYDREGGMMYKQDGLPLGADDGAGVWLLLNMIDAKVPGVYIFHRGEECGGIGSRGMVAHHTPFLEQFKYAIAFDRKGETSIITEQMNGVCCSDTFALGLAKALNDTNPLLAYVPDSTGLFTDTANYRRIIPECTNVSVGYANEHSADELLDVWHLEALRSAVIEAFQEGTGILPVKRDHTAADVSTRLWSGFGATTYNEFTDVNPQDAMDVVNMSFKDLVQWVRMTDPDVVADFLYALSEEIVYQPQDRQEASNEQYN